MKSINSIGEKQESMELSPADGGMTASAADAKRRRLVRGAVAFAPLVLTLRSGALAAASCTGLKIARSSVNNGTGKIAATNAVVGDVCVQDLALTSCGNSANKVLTTSNLTAQNSEPVVLTGQGANQILTCGNPPQFKGQQIAILSSQSASSIGVA